MFETKTTVFYAGGESSYTFPFDYLKKEFVRVRLQTPDGSFRYLEQGKDYSVVEKTVRLSSAASTDEKVCIYRQTPTERLVKYVDASILKANDMNINEIQNLHIMEEQTDNLKTYGMTQSEKGDVWDAKNMRIVNVKDPENGADIANKRYVDTASENVRKDFDRHRKSFLALSDKGDSWNARNLRIGNVATPTSAYDAVNKEYADGLAEKLQKSIGKGGGGSGGVVNLDTALYPHYEGLKGLSVEQWANMGVFFREMKLNEIEKQPDSTGLLINIPNAPDSDTRKVWQLYLSTSGVRLRCLDMNHKADSTTFIGWAVEEE